MSFGFGVAAALGAPLIMTVGFIIWENHWKASAYSLNLFKCCTASLGFFLVCWISASSSSSSSSSSTSSSSLFSDAVMNDKTAVGYLFLSSAVGILIGDWTWLQGLKLLGARRVILMDSLKPFLAAAMGWLVLGEDLHVSALFGIVLTVAGVLAVSLGERKTTMPLSPNENTDIDENDNRNDESVKRTVEMASPPCTAKGEDQNEDSCTAAAGEHTTILGKDGLLLPPAAEDTVVVTRRPHDDTDISIQTADRSNKKMTKTTATVAAAPTTTGCSTSVRLSGYCMSLINVVLDTYGSLLTKQYGVGMTVFEINMLRFGFAGVCMLVLSVLLHVWAAAWVQVVALRRRQQQRDKTTSQSSTATPDQLSLSLPHHQQGDCHEEKADEDNKNDFVANNDDDQKMTHTEKININICTKATTTNENNNNETASSSTITQPPQPPWYALPSRHSMTRSAWCHVTAGVALVTFLTPTLSNYALFQITLAMALTLGSVGPLYALPLSYWMAQSSEQREPLTARACLGAVLAVAGISVLAFWGKS